MKVFIFHSTSSSISFRSLVFNLKCRTEIGTHQSPIWIKANGRNLPSRPWLYSPRKPLVPCRVQVFNIRDVVRTNRWLADYSLASRPFLIHGTGVIESTLTCKMIMKECENGSIKSMVTPNPLRTRSRIPFTQKLWHYRTQPDLAECNNRPVPVCAPPL